MTTRACRRGVRTGYVKAFRFWGRSELQVKDFRAIELSLLCRIYAIRSCFLSFLALLEVVLCWLRSPAFAFFGVSFFLFLICLFCFSPLSLGMIVTFGWLWCFPLWVVFSHPCSFFFLGWKALLVGMDLCLMVYGLLVVWIKRVFYWIWGYHVFMIVD